jgi:putative transport protein
VIGTAGEAINRLTLPDAEKTVLLNNIPVAYAVTYLIGTASLVWFIPTIGPKLMRINLREEGLRMQAEIVGGAEAALGMVSPNKIFDVRTYRVTNPALVNQTVAQLEALPENFRVSILRLRHDGQLVDATPDTVVFYGDSIAILARKEAHLAGGNDVGPEVDDKELIDVPIEVLDVMVTNRAVIGKSLPELAQHEYANGVFLRKLTRAGQDIPVATITSIDRGDLLRLVGTKPKVDRAAQALGYPDRPTTSTDMVFVGTGIVLGGLVGLLSVTVAGIPLTLTASGGALVMGLVFGWLRSAYPYFGRIPEPAIWIFDTLGLCVFIAVVGLNAGPSFVSGLKTSGISLVFVGLVAALLPHTIGILFGRYVLKMNPLIVLGACAGAGTITAALRAVQDEAQSSVPALGYTVPYAIGNILLTAWGPVLVGLMSIGK